MFGVNCFSVLVYQLCKRLQLSFKRASHLADTPFSVSPWSSFLLFFPCSLSSTINLAVDAAVVHFQALLLLLEVVNIYTGRTNSGHQHSRVSVAQTKLQIAISSGRQQKQYYLMCFLSNRATNLGWPIASEVCACPCTRPGHTPVG